MDPLSTWIDMKQLKGTSASDVIDVVKYELSTHGIETLVVVSCDTCASLSESRMDIFYCSGNLSRLL